MLGAFTSLNHDIWGNEFSRLFTSLSLVSGILDHEVRWHSRCYFCESFHGRFLGKHFWTTWLPVEVDHDIGGLPHPLPPHFHFHFLSAGCTDNTGMEGTGRKGRDLESWRELYRKQTSRRASPSREGTWGGSALGRTDYKQISGIGWARRQMKRTGLWTNFSQRHYWVQIHTVEKCCTKWGKGGHVAPFLLQVRETTDPRKLGLPLNRSHLSGNCSDKCPVHL